MRQRGYYQNVQRITILISSAGNPEYETLRQNVIQMNTNTIEIFGKIAGLAGLSLAVFLLLFRDFIRAKFLPTLQANDAYKLIRLFLVLTSLVAVFGISAWVYASENSRSASNYDAILDGMVVDFQSTADNFFNELKKNKSYKNSADKYSSIISKINSIIIRCESLRVSINRYTFILAQAKIVKREFEKIEAIHKKEGALSEVFIDDARTIYDEFSKSIQTLSSVK